jgi:hypothetical protein
MRADFHLLRQSALGVCGAALLGFSLGGCVSTHKPRFWDQQDVKNSPDATNSPTAATAATDPAAAAKPAPTVVAADHATTSDASGHVESSDFADSTPSAPGAQNPAASSSQPTAPPKPASGSGDDIASNGPPAASADAFGDPKPAAAPAPKNSDVMPGASDSFTDSATPVLAGPSPSAKTPVPDAGSKASGTTSIVSSSPGARNANPFADADDPVFVGKGQGHPAAPPAPPQAPDAVASSPPAVPQQSDLFETAPQAGPTPTPKSTVALSDKGRNAADPFAESQPITAPKAPVAPAPMAAEGPNCAAPAPTMPPASAESLPATSAPKQASTPVAQVPSRAPASTEQAVDFEPVVTIPQASRNVVPTSRSGVAAKPETMSGISKPAIQETPNLESKEPEWTPASGIARPANVSDAMILDSGSVRGRFTGIERPKAKTSRSPAAPLKEVPSQPTTQPIASPQATEAPPTPPAATPAPPTESVPNLETEGAFAPASPNVPAVGQTTHEPAHKPLSGVVNAVAQQVSPAAVADPFALEQAVETSATSPSKPPEPHALASVSAAQEVDPFGQPSLLDSHETPSAESTAMAPIQAHRWPTAGSEIAFIIGLTVGLSAGLLVWLRSRLRKADVPNV